MSDADRSELRTHVRTADDLDRELNRVSMRAWITNRARPSIRFRGREVERLIGRGAMGGVFLARSPQLDRHVALKLIGGQASGVEHLAREARALAQIDHPNVVKVHAVDLEGPTGVIEMEFVDGVNLGQWSRTRPKVRTVVEAYAAAGDGLVAIHGAGLVHRDVKPDNILRRDDGRIVVVDLGLALEEQPGDAAARAPHAGGSPRTRIAGTPGYMAPEVVLGDRPTAAADQFGLACSLYESIEGTLPFPVDGTRDAFLAKVRAGPAAQGPAGAPRWLRGAIRRGLAFDPGARFPSMSAFVDELRRGLARPRRWWRWGGAGAVTAVVTALSWTVATREDPCPAPTSLLRPAWSEHATAAVEERLVLEDADAGPNALAVLTGALDRAQDRWARETTMLCHAERADEPTAQRRACLRHVGASASAHVQAVAARTVDPLGAAVAAAEELERLPSCADRALEGPGRAPWNDVRAASLDARLDDAWTADVLGQFDDAHELLDGILDDAHGLPGVRARALYQRGHLFGNEDRTRAALSSLDDAHTQAFAAGNDRLLCDILIYQAKVQALLAEAPTAAARDIELATACLERTGDHSDLVWAEALESQGLYAQQSGQPKVALALHARALQLRQGTLGAEHVSCAKSLHNMGNASAALEDWDTAHAAFERALTLRTGVLGAEHPTVADIWFDLGDMQRNRGELGHARVSLEQARSIYEAHGTHQQALAITDLTLALVALAQGEGATARQHLRYARARHDGTNSEHEALWTADLLHTEGVQQIGEGDFEEARARFARATELLRRHDGRAPAVYDSTLRELEMLFGLEAYARIAARVRREEPWLSRHLQTLDPAERGRFAWYIAVATKQAPSALSPTAYWRTALDAYQAIDDPLSVQELHWELALALAQDGRARSEAIEHASAALMIEGGPPQRRDAIAEWIAKHSNSNPKVEQ